MAFGLRPTKIKGEGYNSKGFGRYLLSGANATALFRGDPVKVSAGYIERAGVADKPIGVFWGASYYNDESQPVLKPHIPASTSITQLPIDALYGQTKPVAYVVDDPRIVMEVQADSSVSAGLFGQNFQVSVGTGNTVTGLSGAVLKVASATTSGGDATSASNATMVRLVGIKEMPDNDIGDANPILLVTWNYHADSQTNS